MHQRWESTRRRQGRQDLAELFLTLVQDDAVCVHQRPGGLSPDRWGIEKQRHMVIGHGRRTGENVGSYLQLIGTPEINHRTHTVAHEGRLGYWWQTEQTVRTEEGAPAYGTTIQGRVATRVAQVVGAFEVEVTGRGWRRGMPHKSLSLLKQADVVTDTDTEFALTPVWRCIVSQVSLQGQYLVDRHPITPI